jgi:release factor glutamine methyltransferase
VGDVTFNGLALVSAPGRVMTPRPASEGLVAAAARRIGGRAARVADVGTGSGALAIAIAVACPAAEVWASDNDAAAVLLARENVRRHRLAGRVFVRRGDLLAPLPGSLDLVVANLPYIAAATAAEHPDLRGEPPGAVFAAGDGFGPYRRLLAEAATRLLPDGAIVLQLHRRVLTATRAEIPALRAALDGRAR